MVGGIRAFNCCVREPTCKDFWASKAPRPNARGFGNHFWEFPKMLAFLRPSRIWCSSHVSLSDARILPMASLWLDRNPVNLKSWNEQCAKQICSCRWELSNKWLLGYCRGFDSRHEEYQTKKIILEAGEKAYKASAVVLHTFDALERDILAALSTMFRRIYAIGPLHLLIRHAMENPTELGGINLWKEETECFQWLDSKSGSIVYVNFGSEVVLTQEQLIEFGMGLADSNHNFLWVTRPNLVAGHSAILPPEFTARTKKRGMILSWCPQEQVLNHASAEPFLTHCGWNSMLECFGWSSDAMRSILLKY